MCDVWVFRWLDLLLLCCFLALALVVVVVCGVYTGQTAGCIQTTEAGKSKAAALQR